jgi:hypothetical protein
LIDASGRGNLTGNQENLREITSANGKSSPSSAISKCRARCRRGEHDTIIVRLKTNGFGSSRSPPTKTSVGIVIDKDEFAQSKKAGRRRKFFNAGSSPVPP